MRQVQSADAASKACFARHIYRTIALEAELVVANDVASQQNRIRCAVTDIKLNRLCCIEAPCIEIRNGDVPTTSSPPLRLSPAGVKAIRICRVKHCHIAEVYVATKSGNATGDKCLRDTECFNASKKGAALPFEREAACVQKLCWLSEIRGQMHGTVKRDVKRTITYFKVSYLQTTNKDTARLR